MIEIQSEQMYSLVGTIEAYEFDSIRLEEFYMEVSKSDWKLFRSSIAEWQESYMEHLVKEY